MSKNKEEILFEETEGKKKGLKNLFKQKASAKQNTEAVSEETEEHKKGLKDLVKHKESNKKQYKKKYKRKITTKDILVLAIPAAAALVAVIVVLIVTNVGTSYKFKDSGHQYYGGSSAVVSSGTEMKVSEDGSVVFTSNNAPTELPVYLNSSRTVVMTKDMIYYMPRSESYTRAPSLSEVTCLENGMITVSKDGKSENPETGFLYDGNDFYIFLEPVVVTYMGYKVELPSLSYAEVQNGGTIMLFNYETKEFIMEMLEGTAYAATKYGDYNISLLGDSMTDINGELTLLMTRPEEIDPLV